MSESKKDAAVEAGLEGATMLRQGAEARVYKVEDQGRPTIVKERFSKKYRHPDLDRKLIKQRMSTEVKCIAKCHKSGLDVPTVYRVDDARYRMYLEFVDGQTVRDFIFALDMSKEEDQKRSMAVADRIGRVVAAMHSCGVVHGDLTTSNMMLRKAPRAAAAAASASASASGAASAGAGEQKAAADQKAEPPVPLVLIDFGLAFVSTTVENRAVDLYVLEKAFLSTHPESEKLFQAVLAAYHASSTGQLAASKVLQQLYEVRKRGRKRDMSG